MAINSILPTSISGQNYKITEICSCNIWGDSSPCLCCSEPNKLRTYEVKHTNDGTNINALFPATCDIDDVNITIKNGKLDISISQIPFSEDFSKCEQRGSVARCIKAEFHFEKEINNQDISIHTPSGDLKEFTGLKKTGCDPVSVQAAKAVCELEKQRLEAKRIEDINMSYRGKSCAEWYKECEIES